MALNIPHPQGNRAAVMANIKAQIAQAAAINQAMKAGSIDNQPTNVLPQTASTQRPPTKQANTLTKPTQIVNPYGGPPSLYSGNLIAPPPPEEKPDTAAQKAAALQRRSIESSRQLLNALKMNARRANQGLANIPSPGDIWVPFWILIFIFMILIPVGGHTRLAWLWLVIIGHAEISGETIEVPQYGNGGASGIIQGIIGAITGGIGNAVNPPASPSNPGNGGNNSTDGKVPTPLGITATQPPGTFGNTTIVPYLESTNIEGL